MFADRRQYARCRIERPAYASIAGSPRAVIVDASERGVGLQSQAPLVGQLCVEAKVYLAEGAPSIVSVARVAWSDGHGRAGIEFIDLSPDSRWQLQRWLNLNVTLAANRTERASGHAATTAHNRVAFQKLSADAQLASAAERALLLTRGAGSAIALRDGQWIVCRAAAGELALPIGSQIDPQSGISGACVRLGRLLVCNCADSDPHVDRESCRSLGISSVIVAPIRNGGSTVGVVEVFSREPNAFDKSDCYALEKLAELIAGFATASKSLDEPRSQLRVGTAQNMGTPPSHAAEAAPTQSADLPGATRAPMSSGAMVSEVANGNPRFINPAAPASYKSRVIAGLTFEKRAAFGIGVAALLVVGLWLGAGTRVESSKAALSTTAAKAKLAAQNPSPVLSSLLPVSALPVQPDFAEEVRRKAERGDANAQFQLGAQYASSEDMENNAQAVKWLTRSAENGNVLAAATLGAFYWAGRRVTQDYVKAYMWSAIAKAEGDEASGYRVAILRSRLSPTELTDAEVLAADWLHTHHKQRALKENALTRR